MNDVFAHVIQESAEGVCCTRCGKPAAHKVAEVLNDEDARHEFTAYLCCNCFSSIMGPTAKRLCFDAKIQKEVNYE